jgi:chromosome segregation ATPase
MGYKRGKENSKAKHYSVAIGHQKEELENLKKQIQEQKKLIKQQNISLELKKEELDKLDIILKQTRTKIKEIKNLTVLDSQIDQDIDSLIKSSKGLFKLDEDELRINLKKKLQEYSKSDFKSLQEQNIKRQVIVQENKINKLQNDYNAIYNTNYVLKSDNTELILKLKNLEELEDKNLLLVEENQELKSDIQELEKVYKFNYQEFKENRNYSRQRN